MMTDEPTMKCSGLAAMTATVKTPSPNGIGPATFDPALWQFEADRLIEALPELARGPVCKAIGKALGATLHDDQHGNLYRRSRG